MTEPTSLEEMRAAYEAMRESAMANWRAFSLSQSALLEIERRAATNPYFTGAEAAKIAAATRRTISDART